MTTRLKSLAVGFVILIVFCVTAAAQTPGNEAQTERVANQIGMLRQSVQSLDATLAGIAEKFIPLYAKAGEEAAANVNRISGNVALLTQAEHRAESLRRQLFDLIEKETVYRSRITQIEEDMRPDNVERALNPYGTTRTVEARDTRRRVLESERRGFESLLSLAAQSRIRLDEDVRQADGLVARIRQRVFPAIERQIEKINQE
jgi:hypothetical protein